eukprot:CAMPEP_0206498382 /NCGR_PEP_ID=MMETSP0324_2-20121206/50945_1 /ASSEMBLY_ACC=CAM_ASM_000836 /TAXON_ID=2866 /ORGANISM="Crypthecodinium cohnii, Strain Seligo" /LENGTH=123 /DNA_ID=CAMNT_0053984527 /DNA_START=865 /DNA_END=1232 /DNA_ORIENTATION=+
MLTDLSLLPRLQAIGAQSFIEPIDFQRSLLCVGHHRPQCVGGSLWHLLGDLHCGSPPDTHVPEGSERDAENHGEQWTEAQENNAAHSADHRVDDVPSSRQGKCELLSNESQITNEESATMSLA